MARLLIRVRRIPRAQNHPEFVHGLERISVPRTWMRHRAVENRVVGIAKDRMFTHHAPTDRTTLQVGGHIGVHPLLVLTIGAAPPRLSVFVHVIRVRRVAQLISCVLGNSFFSEAGLQKISQSRHGLCSVRI